MRIGSSTLAEIAILALIGISLVVLFADVGSYSPDTRLVPTIFLYITAGLLLTRIGLLARHWRDPAHPGRLGRHDTTPGAAPESLEGDFDAKEVPRRALYVVSSLVVYAILIYLIGLYLAVPVFVVGFSRAFGGLAWRNALLLGLSVAALSYLFFVELLGLPAPAGVLLHALV
ncbi:tripartite tricarboxylate transporter TctB family protein [Afifella pfennigii]|uniref:tripartite tricarboxylate transporter TctB family protein n=1 Tax=Afifella pfennigii TaxID=209897 RepID=UPI0005569537|nr:tripartite tricarboxylate transporter TctB family protein [Afifella pfennigii]